MNESTDTTQNNNGSFFRRHLSYLQTRFNALLVGRVSPPNQIKRTLSIRNEGSHYYRRSAIRMMKTAVRIPAISAAALIMSVFAAVALADDVVVLTEDNFDKEVGKDRGSTPPG